MSDTAAPKETPKGDRIAKVIARAGLASRREAEAMIAVGRVSVNGQTIESAALNVTPADKITVDGKLLAPPERARLWLYHKPTGLVTTTSDEQGRETVFDALPPDMPRVLSVGRLDLNSEGLLLLTNDGDLKRRLELPSTGWLRRYRVRVRGTPTEALLAPLEAGLTVDGERFAPMQVTLDRQQGGNAWLTLGLREGRNREIRRAMESLGLLVNRLIRISYGPFQLGTLKTGEVEEIRQRVLRDQLGEPEMADDDTPRKPRGPKGGKPGRDGGTPSDRKGPAKGPRSGPGGGKSGKPGGKPRSDGRSEGRSEGRGEGRGEGRPARAARTGDDARPKRFDRDGKGPRDGRAGDDKPRGRDGEKPRRFNKEDRPQRRDGDRPARADGDRPKRFNRDDKPEGSRGPRPPRDRDDRPARADGDRPKRFDREDRPNRSDREDRPKRSDREDRPKRFDREDRPGRFSKDGPPRRDRDAEKAEREEKKKQFLSDPSKSLRKDASGAPKRGSARKGGNKSPGAGFYGSRDLGKKGPRKP